MKIGDEVYIHGYVDEIRSNCIIIQNDGGYFGTVENEIFDIYDFIPKEEAKKAKEESYDRGFVNGLLFGDKCKEWKVDKAVEK